MVQILPSDFATRHSPWPVAETMERLRALLDERNMTAFATIDQPHPPQASNGARASSSSSGTHPPAPRSWPRFLSPVWTCP